MCIGRVEMSNVSGAPSVNLIPVRCFTCGQVVGRFWHEWRKQRKAKGWASSEAAKDLDKFGLFRYCCRRMLLSHTELFRATEAIKFVQPRPNNQKALKIEEAQQACQVQVLQAQQSKQEESSTMHEQPVKPENQTESV